MKRLFFLVLSTIICSSFSFAALQKTVSQYGITWEFDQQKEVGQFVNGDYYVVGPATVIKITPAPSGGRNGSVLDLKVSGKTYTSGKVGFDSRIVENRYDASQLVIPPLTLQPGNSLLSSISMDPLGQFEQMLRPGYYAPKIPIQTLAVLTCLNQAVDADAFRPAYADQANKLYYARNLHREYLPSLVRPGNTPTLAEFERYLERPWLDMAYDEFTAPVQNMPVYGREYSRCVGMANLLLCLDFTPTEKEKLLIRYVQLGIDLYGLLKAGFLGWPATGGHGNGRKLPIMFAGWMLGEPAMQQPQVTFPNAKFSEDMQTMYDTGWTGASVVFAGHAGKDGHPNHPDWGAYEHLHPQNWLGNTGESYRRCCTSHTWVGMGLAAKILHLENLWAHDSFFDYVDRWMTEDDTEHVAIIKQYTGYDYSASHSRQRQTWDQFVTFMYMIYRNNLPPSLGSIPGKQDKTFGSIGYTLLPNPLRSADRAKLHKNIQLFSLTGSLIDINYIKENGVYLIRQEKDGVLQKVTVIK